MGKNSKFIQLSPQILLEYIYDDPASPDIYDTNEYRVEIMYNKYTKSNYFFNTDDTELKNIRKTSVVPINNTASVYVLLNTNMPNSYNDIDDNLTETVDLVQFFTPELNIEYDTVKLHMVAGFNFNEYDAYIFEINILQKNGQYTNLLSQAFKRGDSPILNPNPNLVGNKLYSTYLEFKVPSVEYVYTSWASDKNNNNLLGHRLSSGSGYTDTSKIKFSLKAAYNSYFENSFTFFKVRELNTISLNKKDDFENLSAFIQESSAGDFYELYGLFEGSIYADFMAALNQRTDADHIVFHEIVVSEQLENSFIETARQTFVQQDSFQTPIYFRPIILNSNIAVSYSINYQLRIFNKTDNSQIIKTAQLISTDVRKYGRKFTKLNLGTVPTIAKIYNKINSDEGANISFADTLNVSNNITETIVQTEFIKLFQDRINITVAINPISVQNINE